jgi:hypothetical protein
MSPFDGVVNGFTKEGSAREKQSSGGQGQTQSCRIVFRIPNIECSISNVQGQRILTSILDMEYSILDILRAYTSLLPIRSLEALSPSLHATFNIVMSRL